MRKLPLVIEAGRGENWTDYGHHEEGIPFSWNCGHGFTIGKKGSMHSDLRFPNRDYFHGGAIAGRVDGLLNLATICMGSEVDPGDLPIFLSELADKWPKVKQIRRFWF